MKLFLEIEQVNITVLRICILLLLSSCAEPTNSKETTPNDTVIDSSSETQNDTTQTVETSCVWPDTKYFSVDNVFAMSAASCPGLLFLNVVDEEFYNLGHIPGSIEIPWDELAGRLSEVDAEKKIVVYCRKGVRSESAYTTLDNAGFPSLVIMEDGIEAWIAAGYEVETID